MIKDKSNNGLKNPYHPLRSLDKQDRNILVGREKDADGFIAALSSPKTRVLILNGEPGVGKSSFLQAELIPKLESSFFPFKRFDLLDFDKKNIIFCGADPVESLARAVFHSRWKEQFIEISRKIKKKKGRLAALVEKIKQIKKDYKPEEDIWIELAEIFESSEIEQFKNFLKNRDGLSNFLCLFSFYSPYTKLLIFDHIEQLFCSSGIKNVNEFLEGIRYFSKYDCDAKIILSIRADSLAQLRSKIYSHLFPENVRDIYLNDIEDEKYLIEAIKKPCINAGCCFADENFPEEIVRELKKKKVNNVSALPVLHIIGYRIFDNMMKRIKKEDERNEIDKEKDMGNSKEDKYVNIISSFLLENIKNIWEENSDNFKFQEGDIKKILYELVDFNSKRRKLVDKDFFVKRIKSELKYSLDKIERILIDLSKSRIVVQADPEISYLFLSHDLFAEAIVFFKDKSEQLEKTGLIDLFENKRDPGIENAMISILNDFKSKFQEYPSEKLRIASVVGKQFFHKNDNLYQYTNDLLETIKNCEFTAQAPSVKVLVIKPFSKLFLYRAESEVGLSVNSYCHDSIHNNRPLA